MKHISIVTLAAGLLFVTSSVYSQVTTQGNTAGPGTEYVGWDGTGVNTKPLDIENRFSNEDIIFRTNDGTLTERMIIKDDGKVGIGYNHAPNHRLDVAGGDINIYGMANGYRIGGSGGMPSKYVLWPMEI